MKNILLKSLTACAATALLAFAGTASAQDWRPSGQITLVVPWAAGGGAEPVARIIADGLTEAFEVPVVLDFRPGASGTIGTHRVSQSPADGHTFVVTSQAPFVNIRFRPETPPFDPDTDMTPIAVIAEAPFVIAASAHFGPSTLQEVVEYAKANPGAINAGVSGLGGSGHMAATVLAFTTDIELTYVPYAGVGERLADLMAGRLDIATGIGASGYLPGIEAGSIKPIAVLGSERLQELPDTPTSIEQGYPNTVVSGWYLIAGPGGLPDEITNTVNEVVVSYLEREDVQQRMLEIGNIAATSTVEGVREKIEKETALLGALVGSGLFEIP